jgi:predicted MFS family arabinose efflux permease
LGSSTGYANYVLFVLTVVYVFNNADRNVLSILLPDIQAELGASDTAMGLLAGIFVLFYSTLGIPIARWADRGNRRSILALGVLFWSAMTAASGAARSFAQLVIARLGLGAGEAAGTPPSHSLISDYFPPERRGRALSVYAMGNYAGAFVGLGLGGWINQMYGWRAAFWALGLPGIALALLVRLTVREPARGVQEPGGPAAPVPLREALTFLRRQRSFLWLNVAGAVSALVGYGFAVWGPTYMMRVHEMGSAEVGQYLGVLAPLGGIIGTWIGGVLVDRRIRRDARWFMWIPAISSLVNLPISALLLLGTKFVAIASYAPHSLLHAMYVGPLFASMQALARPRVRALAVAIHMAIVNLFGLLLGPLAVGMLNDALEARLGAHAVRYSLLMVSLTGFFAGLLYLVAARNLREDLQRAREDGE